MAVRSSTVFLHFEIDSLLRRSSGDRSDYLEGVGRFAYKDVDKTLSDDDIKLELVKAREIDRRNDYLERVGGFEGKNGADRRVALGITESDDAPTRRGYGATWDKSGICDSRKCGKEIMEATKEGYFIDGIITIDRENTSALGLENKQDFQRLTRSHVDGLIDSWNMFEPGDACWYAEYHADAKRSLHVHLTIWDSSGRWPGAKGLPGNIVFHKDQLLAGNDFIRRAAFSSLRVDRSFEKDYLRSRIQAELYKAIQGPAPLDVMLRCLSKQHSISSGSVKPFDPELSHVARSRYLDEIKDTLPKSEKGSIRYAYTSKETKLVVNRYLRHLLDSNPDLKHIHDTYLENVREHGAMKGLAQNSLMRFVNDDRVAMERSLRNIILKVAVGESGISRSRSLQLQPSLPTVKSHLSDISDDALYKEAAKSVFYSARSAWHEEMGFGEDDPDEKTVAFAQLIQEAKEHALLSGDTSPFDIKALVEAYKLSDAYESLRTEYLDKAFDLGDFKTLDSKIYQGMREGICRAIEADFRAEAQDEISLLDLKGNPVAEDISAGIRPDKNKGITDLFKDIAKTMPTFITFETVSESVRLKGAQQADLVINNDSVAMVPYGKKVGLEELLGKDRYEQVIRLSNMTIEASPKITDLFNNEYYWASKRISHLPDKRQGDILDSIKKRQVESVAISLTYKACNKNQEILSLARPLFEETIRDPFHSQQIAMFVRQYHAGYPIDKLQIDAVIEEFAKSPYYQGMLTHKINTIDAYCKTKIDRETLSSQITQRLKQDLERNIQKSAERITRFAGRNMTKLLIKDAASHKGQAIQVQLASLKQSLPKTVNPKILYDTLYQPGVDRKAAVISLVGTNAYSMAESVAKDINSLPALYQIHAHEIHLASQRLEFLPDDKRYEAICRIGERQLEDTTIAVINHSSKNPQSRNLGLTYLLAEIGEYALLKALGQNNRPYDLHKNRRLEREHKMIRDASNTRMLER